MKYTLKISLILITAFISQGCANVKEGLSLKKKDGIDEFLIEKKNPLTVPPDFSSLPKPRNSMDENKIEDKDIDLTKVLTETDENNSSPSNGLENFDFDEETPELFNSDGSISETEEETSLSTETSTTREEEDDLEIPAFLRRQKN